MMLGRVRALALFTLLLLPTVAHGAESGIVLGLRLKLFTIGVITSIFLLLVAHMLHALFNWRRINDVPLSTIEKEHPILPRVQVALWILSSILLLVFCVLDGYLWSSWIRVDAWISWVLLVVLFSVTTFTIRLHQHEVFFERLYAGIIGSIMVVAFIGFSETVFDVNGGSTFAVTGLFLTIALFWQFLFSPWRNDIKVIITAVFIACIAINAITYLPESMRFAYALAIAIAALPAILWTRCFLWNTQKDYWVYGAMFLAGILATLPISFYRILTEEGRVVDLLFIRIVPLNIFASSNIFVSENAIGFIGIQHIFLSTVLAFFVAAVIEEVCKYWVLRHTQPHAFEHLHDVMQYAIIVAIGFAFAENIINPQYFPAFIEQHILTPTNPEWVTFMRKIIGRSFLSTTAHVVASATCGYFVGKSIFAHNYTDLPENKRPRLLLPLALQWLLNLPYIAIWQRQLLVIGISSAIVVHTLFNVIITLPTTIPSFPQTLSDIAQSTIVRVILSKVSISLIAIMTMVGAGLWLLLYFSKKIDRAEHQVVTTDSVTTPKKFLL